MMSRSSFRSEFFEPVEDDSNVRRIGPGNRGLVSSFLHHEETVAFRGDVKDDLGCEPGRMKGDPNRGRDREHAGGIPEFAGICFDGDAFKTTSIFADIKEG